MIAFRQSKIIFKKSENLQLPLQNITCLLTMTIFYDIYKLMSVTIVYFIVVIFIIIGFP